MPFYTMNELLALDPAKDWCIGHFNVHNYTTLGGVVKAAEEMKAPAILALGAQAYKHIGMENIMALCFSAMEQSNARFALHIDHARDLGLIRKALRLGASSVMFDGSSLSFEENIRMTKEMVQMAHDYGASAEGEVGEVPMPGGSRADIMYTDPDQAAEFAERTGVDFLAVSLGSIHGMKTSSMDLDQGTGCRCRHYSYSGSHGQRAALRPSVEEKGLPAGSLRPGRKSFIRPAADVRAGSCR